MITPPRNLSLLIKRGVGVGVVLDDIFHYGK